MELCGLYNSSRKSIILNILLALFLLCGTANAQLAAKDQLFLWDNFSGGLNSKTTPFGLGSNEGVTVQNVRIDTHNKALTKRSKTLLTFTTDASETPTSIHRFYSSGGTKKTITTHGTTIESCDDTEVCTDILSVSSGDNKWQWITWHDIAIGTDGVNQPVKYDGSSDSATYLGSALATDADSGAGPTGVISYKIAFYTSTYEVLFDQISNTLTLTDNDVDLTMIPIAPTTYIGEDVIGRKIYRTGNGDSTYKLVSDVGDSLGTIPNNTATTTTDSDADGARTDPMPTVDNITIFAETPPKGKYLLLHKARLFLSNNSSNPSGTWWSEIEKHDYFDSTETFNVRKNDGDEITGIKNQLGQLIVFKDNTISKIYTVGATPSEDWAVSAPVSHIGCQAPYSIANTATGIFYLGNDGIYNFTGQYSQYISDNVTFQIKDIQPSNIENVWSAYYKNKYFMAYTSSATGSSTNNRVLIYDLVSKAFSIDLQNIDTFEIFDGGTDIEALYSGSSTTGKIFAHLETTKEIAHSRHRDFTGTWDSMRYIPTSVGGDPESPILEITQVGTIDELVGTVDSLTGIIDRKVLTGNYTSQFLTLNANTFDKIYWSERIPVQGGDATFNIRAGATTVDCLAATWWSSEFDVSSGSDISAVTADSVVQYRTILTTNEVEYTPTLVRDKNYVVRITYSTVGATEEETIPMEWETGWEDFSVPGYIKTLRKIYVYYDWDAPLEGTLNISFENLDGDTDTFAIDLFDYPAYYVEYFTNGAFSGTHIKMTIEESSLNPITIKRILVVYDIEPLV